MFCIRSFLHISGWNLYQLNLFSRIAAPRPLLCAASPNPSQSPSSTEPSFHLLFERSPSHRGKQRAIQQPHLIKENIEPHLIEEKNSHKTQQFGSDNNNCRHGNRRQFLSFQVSLQRATRQSQWPPQ